MCPQDANCVHWIKKSTQIVGYLNLFLPGTSQIRAARRSLGQEAGCCAGIYWETSSLYLRLAQLRLWFTGQLPSLDSVVLTIEIIKKNNIKEECIGFNRMYF